MSTAPPAPPPHARPSLLKMTVERPRDLFAFLVPMLEKSGGLHRVDATPEELAQPAERHFSFIDQEVFLEMAEHCLALSDCQCKQTEASAIAATVFWWFAIAHEGVEELVMECEPEDSWWRHQPDAFHMLIRFVSAHIIRITGRDMDERTVPYQARLFHLAMLDVLTSPPERAVAIMQKDGANIGEKTPKDEKQKLKKEKAPKSVTEAATAEHYRRYGHLPGIRRGRAIKKKLGQQLSAELAAEQAQKMLSRDLEWAEVDAATEQLCGEIYEQLVKFCADAQDDYVWELRKQRHHIVDPNRDRAVVRAFYLLFTNGHIDNQFGLLEFPHLTRFVTPSLVRLLFHEHKDTPLNMCEPEEGVNFKAFDIDRDHRREAILEAVFGAESLGWHEDMVAFTSYMDGESEDDLSVDSPATAAAGAATAMDEGDDDSIISVDDGTRFRS